MNNSTALATQQNSGGIVDMNGGAGAMAANLNEMKMKLSMVQNFMKEVMDDGFDYGIIPGTEKPCLFKPGAEKMLSLYGFSSIVKEKKETRDLQNGYYLAELTMQIIHRATGAIIAEGVGEASSFESKYRYRWFFENELPKGTDKTGLFVKEWESKDRTKTYTKYRMENQDLIDQWNTVLKMAKKRALVDATLTATGTSGIFNQTVDEMGDWIDNEGDNRLQKREPLQKKKSAPTAADEKGTFNPSASTSNLISDAQRKKIFFDALQKGIQALDMEAIVKFTKKKTLSELSKNEASAVIDFLAKSSNDDLQDLVIEIAMDGASK